MSTAPERLRLAVAGCGRVWERYHLPAIERGRDWRVVGACDPDLERRRMVESRCPGVCVRATLSELLDAAPADALLVATPPASHAGLAVQALHAGLSVLVEKPMATTVSDARAVCDASLRSPHVLAVGFNRRFREPYRRLRRRIASEGARTIEAELCFASERWDTAAQPVLEDVASHGLDLLPWLAGRPLEAVRAFPEGPPGSREVSTLVHLAGCRFRGKPSTAAASFERQLAAFAEAVRKSGGDSLASAGDGLRAVLGVEACRQSLLQLGARVPLNAGLLPDGEAIPIGTVPPETP